jgi:hypothetical protein
MSLVQRFIIVNRAMPSKSIFADCSDEVGFFLRDKHPSDWIVIRDGRGIVVDEVVHVRGSTVSEIATSCRGG